MRILGLTLVALLLGMSAPAFADSEALRICRTDKNGTRTCETVTVKVQTDRIMGIPASKYEHGLKAGKCMPSPAGPGVCGGE